MSKERIGWSRGRPLLDAYTHLMDLAADAENRAAALDSAMEVVEAEIGGAAFASDAGIRAALWSDTLRAHARRFREEAEATRTASAVRP